MKYHAKRKTEQNKRTTTKIATGIRFLQRFLQILTQCLDFSFSVSLNHLCGKVRNHRHAHHTHTYPSDSKKRCIKVFHDIYNEMLLPYRASNLDNLDPLCHPGLKCTYYCLMIRAVGHETHKRFISPLSYWCQNHIWVFACPQACYLFIGQVYLARSGTQYANERLQSCCRQINLEVAPDRF